MTNIPHRLVSPQSLSRVPIPRTWGANPRPAAQHGRVRRDVWRRWSSAWRITTSAVPPGARPPLSGPHGRRSGSSGCRRRRHVGSEYPALPAGAAYSGFVSAAIFRRPAVLRSGLPAPVRYGRGTCSGEFVLCRWCVASSRPLEILGVREEQ